MNVMLKCQVSPGQFTGECAVKIQLHDDKWVSLFLPVEAVEIQGALSDEDPVDGYIEVNVIDQEGGLTLVRLPRPTLENGQHLTVKADAIQQEA